MRAGREHEMRALVFVLVTLLSCARGQTDDDWAFGHHTPRSIACASHVSLSDAPLSDAQPALTPAVPRTTLTPPGVPGSSSMPNLPSATTVMGETGPVRSSLSLAREYSSENIPLNLVVQITSPGAQLSIQSNPGSRDSQTLTQGSSQLVEDSPVTAAAPNIHTITRALVCGPFGEYQLTQ